MTKELMTESKLTKEEAESVLSKARSRKTFASNKEEAYEILQAITCLVKDMAYDDTQSVLKKYKERTSMANAINKTSQLERRNNPVKESSKEKVDLALADIAGDIEVLKKRLVKYEQTQSAEEAYWNIWEDRSLRSMTSYVRYARTYVYECLKTFEEKDLQYVTICALSDSTNTLPLLAITLADWSTKDEHGQLRQSHYLQSDTIDIDVSSLRPYIPALKDFNMNVKSFFQNQDKVEDIKEKGNILVNRYLFLPPLRRRVKKNVPILIQRNESQTLHPYSGLQRAYRNIEDKHLDMETERSIVLDELRVTIAFVKEKFGYDITLIHADSTSS